MPEPVRFGPTRKVAELTGVTPRGSPLMLTPEWITPPWSRPAGPASWAGEPVRRLNQSHMICAAAQLVKLVVSESWGTYLSRGLFVVLFPPGPVQRDRNR